MNIDKKLEKIIIGDSRHDMILRGISLNYSIDETHEMIDKTISQIKQSILKAIMERKPKIDNQNIERDNFEKGLRCGWNNALLQFESVIKEVLK